MFSYFLASLALQRLRISDDGFRKQLEAKELSHNNYIKELTEQYELQIAEKQHRVCKKLHHHCTIHFITHIKIHFVAVWRPM